MLVACGLAKMTGANVVLWYDLILVVARPTGKVSTRIVH